MRDSRRKEEEGWAPISGPQLPERKERAGAVGVADERAPLRRERERQGVYTGGHGPRTQATE